MRLLMIALLVSGCSGPSNNGPPPPAADEILVAPPTVKAIAPGANITYCTYLDQNVADQIDVIGSHGMMSTGGHHAIVYAAKRTRPVGTHECNEDDMTNGFYLAGIGADKGSVIGTLPDGVAFRIAANTQLYVQTHWINATNSTFDGTTAVYLKTTPVSADRVPADLFAVADVQFDIPAGQIGTSSTSCTVKEDLNLFLLAGHEHQWGTHFTIEHDATMVYDKDWIPEYELNPPINLYPRATPLTVKAGETFKVTCTWDNTASATDLTFPTDMCVGWGFYFPGHGEIDCVNGAWPG